MRPARGPGLPNQLGDIMPHHGEAEPDAMNIYNVMTYAWQVREVCLDSTEVDCTQVEDRITETACSQTRTQ